MNAHFYTGATFVVSNVKVFLFTRPRELDWSSINSTEPNRTMYLLFWYPSGMQPIWWFVNDGPSIFIYYLINGYVTLIICWCRKSHDHFLSNAWKKIKMRMKSKKLNIPMSIDWGWSQIRNIINLGFKYFFPLYTQTKLTISINYTYYTHKLILVGKNSFIFSLYLGRTYGSFLKKSHLEYEKPKSV